MAGLQRRPAGVHRAPAEHDRGTAGAAQRLPGRPQDLRSHPHATAHPWIRNWAQPFPDGRRVQAAPPAEGGVRPATPSGGGQEGAQGHRLPAAEPGGSKPHFDRNHFHSTSGDEVDSILQFLGGRARGNSRSESSLCMISPAVEKHEMKNLYPYGCAFHLSRL